MLGLMIKDIYQLKSYSRVFFVVIVFCIILSVSGKEAVFMTYYPGILMGMMPITLFAYDEKAKFFSLLASLPIKKRTFVTAKYSMGFLMGVMACMVTGGIQAVKMIQAGTFVFSDFLMVMSLAVAISVVTPAIVLPMIFLLGTEKGRFVNIIVIAIAISFINIFTGMGDSFQLIIDEKQFVMLIMGAVFVLYMVSWAISVLIFEKKEY